MARLQALSGAMLTMIALTAGFSAGDSSRAPARNPWFRIPDGERTKTHIGRQLAPPARRDTAKIDTARTDTVKADTSTIDTTKPPRL